MNKEKLCLDNISAVLYFFTYQIFGLRRFMVHCIMWNELQPFHVKKEDKEIEEKYDKCQPFLLYVLYNTECEKIRYK